MLSGSSLISPFMRWWLNYKSPMLVQSIRSGVVMIFGLGLLLLVSDGSAQPTAGTRNDLKFEDRSVTVVEPELDADGFFPKGPASVCIEGPPRRQCYKAGEGDWIFGRYPAAEVVQLDKETSAVFFSAASGGVSGFVVHFALLRPGVRDDLEDLFSRDVSVSEQGEHAFWNVAEISEAPIFVTAD